MINVPVCLSDTVTQCCKQTISFKIFTLDQLVNILPNQDITLTCIFILS